MHKQYLKVSKDIIIISTLIFTINIILKFIHLGSSDIAMDEPFTLFYSQMDIGSIFRMLRTENNPPLHFLIMHFWIKLFGLGEVSVRIPSLIFSSLTAVIIYITGRKFFSGFVGVITSAIFTFSVMHIYFSHEARVYSLFVLLASLSFMYYLMITKEPDRKSSYILLFIINLLLIYSHYFGFFVIITEFVCIFFIAKRKKIYKRILFVFFALSVSYIPNVIVFLNRMSVSVSKGTWVRKPELSEYYGNLNRFLNIKYVTFTFLVILIITLVFLIRNKLLLLKIKEFLKNENYFLTILWFFVPYTLMFIISFRVPMFLDRYILFCSIPFYFLLVQVIFHFVIASRAKIAGSIILILSIILTSSLNPSNKRNVKELVRLIKEIKKENDIVYIAPDYSKLEFTYHYNIDFFKDYKQIDENLKDDGIYPIKDRSEISLDTIISGSMIIYIDCGYRFAFGNNLVFDKLKENYKLLNKYRIPEIYEVSCFNMGN